MMTGLQPADPGFQLLTCIVKIYQAHKDPHDGKREAGARFRSVETNADNYGVIIFALNLHFMLTCS